MIGDKKQPSTLGSFFYQYDQKLPNVKKHLNREMKIYRSSEFAVARCLSVGLCGLYSFMVVVVVGVIHTAHSK